jgi:hypothetical protein
MCIWVVQVFWYGFRINMDCFLIIREQVDYITLFRKFSLHIHRFKFFTSTDINNITIIQINTNFSHLN